MSALWLSVCLACGMAHAQPQPQTQEGHGGQAPAALLSERPGMQADLIAEVAPDVAEREIGRGLASWYGRHFHGRRTASGERFDMHALTAAHPTLPFGSLVRVRSLVNGRTVDVRINDRGPRIKRRVIDLSRAAADSLGLIDLGTGTKRVVLSVLSGGEPPADPDSSHR